MFPGVLYQNHFGGLGNIRQLMMTVEGFLMWRNIITWGDEIYVRRGLQQGDDIYRHLYREKLCGFIGCHNDSGSSMGMLYVERCIPQTRTYSILEGYLINKQREQRLIPHIL